MPEHREPQPQTRSKKTFYLLILVFVLPFLSAALLHLLDLKPSGKSYGHLVQPPQSLQIPALNNLQDQAFKPAQWQKIWSIVMIDNTNCAAPCQAQVHLLKQVHTSMNKEIKRVQRILLVPANVQAATYVELQKKYPGLIVLTVTDAEMVKFAQTFQQVTGSVYLVDPLGNLMMTYPEKFDPKGLRSDLTRLLKNSWAG